MMRKGILLCLLLCVSAGTTPAQTTSTTNKPATATASRRIRRTLPKRRFVLPPTADASKPVALNLHAGVYHCEGTDEFEKYKNEAVLTQQQAVDKGFRPAFGKVCQ